ncbi:hypothetical protein BC834DRAFT_880864 [Gloeopeniophorella convolvens]|nr:hypothetical protein BC834DRAFT_880864 [Gloeopeniophorella convolvens]
MASNSKPGQRQVSDNGKHADPQSDPTMDELVKVRALERKERSDARRAEGEKHREADRGSGAIVRSCTRKCQRCLHEAPAMIESCKEI